MKEEFIARIQYVSSTNLHECKNEPLSILTPSLVKKIQPN
jgi:hypothetical protein